MIVSHLDAIKTYMDVVKTCVAEKIMYFRKLSKNQKGFPVTTKSLTAKMHMTHLNQAF